MAEEKVKVENKKKVKIPKGKASAEAGGKNVEELRNIPYNETKIFTVKNLEEIPPEFRDRAEKKEGLEIETRKTVFGIPVGKSTKTIVGDGYSYHATGKEIKECSRLLQQQ